MDELNRKTIAEFKEAPKNPIAIILDNVRSMHNVGSIFRTADAFLLDGIYLCGYTPKPPHRDIHKTALGATETVHWQYFPTTLEGVEFLMQQGYQIVAIEQVEKSIPLHEFSRIPDEKLAIVFGNEVTGVDNDILKLCNYFVEIPQWGMKHSLNISVAAGIVIWEMTKSALHNLEQKTESHHHT